MQNSVLWRDLERMGGTPCTDTRVPLTTLFHHLASDEALAEFLDNFPSVQKEQAIALIDMAGKLIETTILTLDQNTVLSENHSNV